ncbi:hypothetical protein TIFTF001_015091 [Ficus carica]|uniref:Uncharacterized protein n=1 Tax=Ficus carica TaxID=3494 RepID=A0AA88D7J8_FICCA|nr:hypothetical protein TIFTF001_015091 [Ficus carica]
METNGEQQQASAEAWMRGALEHAGAWTHGGMRSAKSGTSLDSLTQAQ